MNVVFLAVLLSLPVEGVVPCSMPEAKKNETKIVRMIVMANFDEFRSFMSLKVCEVVELIAMNGSFMWLFSLKTLVFSTRISNKLMSR